MKKQIIFLLFLSLTQLTFAGKIKTSHQLVSDTGRIVNDLKVITKTTESRNYKNIATLDFVANYIFQELSKTCDTVYYQPYMVDGKEYKNVIGSIYTDKTKRVIIGAHYDVDGNQEGADDNASGVTGVLELSRLLSKKKLNHRIDFVAYSLEEPPYFRTVNMGSHVHAKWLYDNKIKVKGMICLEMIGYFNTAPNSQSFPLKFLKMFYGDKGDFITVVQKFGNGKFGRKVLRLMKHQKLIRTKSFRGPKNVQGVDFSDHQNYWKYGYRAVMITNTSFFRNNNYHEPTDKMETLDIRRMALVIDEIYLTVLNGL